MHSSRQVAKHINKQQQLITKIFRALVRQAGSETNPTGPSNVELSGSLLPQDVLPSPTADVVIQQGSARITAGKNAMLIKQQISLRLHDVADTENPQLKLSTLTLSHKDVEIVSLPLKFDKVDGSMRAGRIRLETLGDGDVMISRYVSGICTDSLILSMQKQIVVWRTSFPRGCGAELRKMRNSKAGTVSFGARAGPRNVIVLYTSMINGKTNVGSKVRLADQNVDTDCWADVDHGAIASEGVFKVTDHPYDTQLVKVSSATASQLQGYAAHYISSEHAAPGIDAAEADHAVAEQLWLAMARALGCPPDAGEDVDEE